MIAALHTHSLYRTVEYFDSSEKKRKEKLKRVLKCKITEMNNLNNNFAVRVQLYDKKEFVIIEKEKIGNWEAFVRNGKRNKKNSILSHSQLLNLKLLFHLALVKFELDPDCMANVLLWDNNGTPISKDIFEILMMQYINSNSFTIKMCVKSDVNESSVVQVSVTCIFFDDCFFRKLFFLKRIEYF